MSSDNNQNTEVVLVADAKDVAEHKIVAALAYIGVLFLVPLLAAKNSAFARFHTNQGFILFLGWLVVMIISWVPVLGWLPGFLGSILLIVLSVMGVINVLQGKMKKLPLLDKVAIHL